MRHWLGANKDEVADFLAESAQPGYRAAQFRDWLHKRRVDNFDAMKNLPQALRQLLAGKGALRSLAPLDRRETADGLTGKWLFSAGSDSNREEEELVESVLIIEKQLSRRTVCVSSMIGCPLGCRFCATGALGFGRNLSAGEIIEQVYRLDAHARTLGDDMGVSHVVFMGMGEPLLNLGAVLPAAAAFADADGMGLSRRHITLSTAGVPEGIRELAARKVNYRLAVSLHAPNQKLREQLMPAAKRWPLPDLFAALRDFAKVASRDPTFEYCLIDKVNSSPRHAEELARLLGGLKGKVNLIPFNPVPGGDFAPPAAAAVRKFQDILEDAGIPVTVRMEKGAEIGAACGQLRAEKTIAPNKS